MSTPACGNCRYFDADTKSHNNELGWCHYNPPIAKTASESAWPLVAEKDWCGHFSVTADRLMTAAE